MAHLDECQTCRALQQSEIAVHVHETDDPNSRRFVASSWPVTESMRFTASADALAHPLARALWRNGTTEIVLDPDGATVIRADPRAWPFYADGMAVTLREQLALLG